MPGISARREPTFPAILSIAAVIDQMPVLADDPIGLTSSGLFECGHKSGENSPAGLIGTLAKRHGCGSAESCQSLRAQASSSWHSMGSRRPLPSVSTGPGRPGQAETLCWPANAVHRDLSERAPDRAPLRSRGALGVL